MKRGNYGKNKNWRYSHRRSRKGNDSEGLNNDSQVGGSRHPAGLKGREIGLWYWRKSKKAKGLWEDDPHPPEPRKTRQLMDGRPIGSILLSDTKKLNITKLLNETALMYPSKLVGASNSYEHLEETDFKHEFLQHISGSIIKKLQSTTYESSIYKNEVLDDLFLKEMKQKMTTSGYQKMLKFRHKLPSMNMKDEILGLINTNQVVVISGETGCGKTTQVAQFILDDYIQQGRGSECRIVCTQPRRISAISVAERVAQERDERLGISAGFQIRMEHTLPRDRGSILYCTTGVLLKFMEGDPSLNKLSHLILDEIHERDVISDFLITILKDVISYRSDIKIILMSATLNAEAFSKYYDNAPHINIPGFTFPVTDYYLEDVLQNTKYKIPQGGRKWRYTKEHTEMILPYIRKLEGEKAYDKSVLEGMKSPDSEKLNIPLIYELLKFICSQKDDDGSILVFLPGFADIKKLSRSIQENYQLFPRSRYIIIQLHSQLPTIEQKQIFRPAPDGMRKIIIATNIAETSITIEDVTTVIDCGYIKMTNIDTTTGIETLNAEWVSCANASQRRGRAGRVKPGVCYHLFSRARHLLLSKFLKPEVLRTSLEDVVMQLKMLQLGEAAPFLARLMDPPDPESVKNSVILLQRLGALDEDEFLTPLGLNMAKLPVGAQCSKMLLMGALFGCLDPILSAAASLGYKDAFRLSMDSDEADKKKVELSDGTNSDHILMHYAIRGFEQSPNQYHFCQTNYLSMSILRLLQDMRKQLAKLLFDMKFIKSADSTDPANNYNSKNLSLVKAVIVAGLYPNIGISIRNGRTKSISKRFKSPVNENMELHPKSVLYHTKTLLTPLIVYHVRLKSNGILIHDATCVFPLPIIFFGDQFKRHFNSQDDDSFVGVSINGTMRFLCTESTASIVEQLRQRLNQILESKISNPGFINFTNDTPEVKVLRAIIEMITSEDMEDMDLSDYDDN